ncbi:hypothetical protein C8Q76DRAFT_760014 [Earliella scabrosa]|nr:hypothetical protein C8Q76DRAFT_760014 [Earliella scabrosa]
MSSADERAAIASEALAFLVSNYCANAGSGLIVWEYLITLGQEVELFWANKLTGAAVLFYFNRYLNLVNNIYGIVMNMPISDEDCPAFAQSSKIMGIFQYFPWAVFSGLRAFALTRNWPLSTFIFLLSCVPMGVNYAHFHFNSTGTNNPYTGCLTTDDVTSELARKLTIASRSCLITADVLLVYVTWFNMYRQSGPKHPTVKNRLSYRYRILTIWASILAILNSLHLTLSLLSIEYSVRNVGYVTQFSDPLTSILMSRFLLHLQAANRRVLHLGSPDNLTLASSSGWQLGSGSSGPGQLDTLVFERVLGSLGSSLDAGTYSYKDFDEDEDEVVEEKEMDVKGREPGARDEPDGELALESGQRGKDICRSGSMEMTPLSSPQSPAGRSAA